MKNKILYLIPRFSTGGAEKLVLQYAQHFKQSGHEVAVASVVGGGELTQEFTNAGIQLYVSQQKSWRSWLALNNFCKEFKPELVHSHIFSGDLAAFFIVKRHAIDAKWVSTRHCVEFAAPWVRRTIWKTVLHRADKVISVSENVKNFDNDEFKISKEKLVLVRNGVELDQWLNVPDREYNHAILELATVGRLEQQKGHIYLVKALAKLKNHEWRWHIYGEGSLEDSLKQAVQQEGISNRVIWHGVNRQIEREYEKIDIVIQPSLWEGLSLVVMETMAAGKVVVGTPWAAEKLIENRVNGLTIKTKNVGTIVEALTYCFDNRGKLSDISQKARECAKNKFGLDKNISAVAKIYDNLLN